MKKYKVVYKDFAVVGRKAQAQKSERQLDELASQGWELKGVDRFYFYLERDI